MYKHIIEPIFNYDRLNILYEENKDFKILLKNKDFKILSKERKNDILTQRVWLNSTEFHD